MPRLLKQKTFLYSLLGVLALVVVFALTRLFLPPVVLPTVSLPAEPVLRIAGIPITNTLLATWVSMLLLVGLAYVATRRMELVPRSGLQNVFEMIIEGFYNMVEEIVGKEWARKFFPIVMTIFLLVVTSNWLGITPLYGGFGVLEHPYGDETGYKVEWAGAVGILTSERVEAAEATAGSHGAETHAGEGYILAPLLRSAATDLNTTLALAVVAVVLSQYFGLKALGLPYLKKFFAFRLSPMGFIEGIVGLLELVSEFSKVISFSFRLFGNVLAGEVLLGVMAFLIPYV
ncbi:MAG: F0F1 ATP synthase subunit A, partial [Chloroflexi bacterium]|nr:F0F1 ATP synthase subunit A [Chloroflexota bacterium]